MSDQTIDQTGPPIPLPDMDIISQMQIGIVNNLSQIQKDKEAGKPVVYCSVLIPREILKAMDVSVVYSNVLGAYASIFGLSSKYCQLAEEMGVSRDICSVTRCTIGLACCDDRDSFFDMAFAVPDLVVGSNFPCMTESKSYLQVAKKYKCPYYVVDAPINTWGKEIPDYAINYYVSQFKGLINFLEEHGYSFDMDKLREEVAFTRKLNFVLEEIDQLKGAVPIPITAYDSVIASTAPLVLSKEMLTIEIFEQLRDELKKRVESGYSIVDDEKLRLLWIGVPPLADFKLLNYPQKHGAVIAKSLLEFLTGFKHDPHIIDPEKPLESIARAHLHNPVNPRSQAWLDYFVSMASDYKIDGVVQVVQRSCGMLPCLQRLTKDAIYRETGIPSIVFDLDGIDAREYDEKATKATLDSFVETLLTRKGGSNGNTK